MYFPARKWKSSGCYRLFLCLWHSLFTLKTKKKKKKRKKPVYVAWPIIIKPAKSLHCQKDRINSFCSDSHDQFGKRIQSEGLFHLLSPLLLSHQRSLAKSKTPTQHHSCFPGNVIHREQWLEVTITWESLLKHSVEILAKINYIQSSKFSYADMETLWELLK